MVRHLFVSAQIGMFPISLSRRACPRHLLCEMRRLLGQWEGEGEGTRAGLHCPVRRPLNFALAARRKLSAGMRLGQAASCTGSDSVARRNQSRPPCHLSSSASRAALGESGRK